jgi:hypothetical protein
MCSRRWLRYEDGNGLQRANDIRGCGRGVRKGHLDHVVRNYERYLRRNHIEPPAASAGLMSTVSVQARYAAAIRVISSKRTATRREARLLRSARDASPIEMDAALCSPQAVQWLTTITAND